MLLLVVQAAQADKLHVQILPVLGEVYKLRDWSISAAAIGALLATLSEARQKGCALPILWTSTGSISNWGNFSVCGCPLPPQTAWQHSPTQHCQVLPPVALLTICRPHSHTHFPAQTASAMTDVSTSSPPTTLTTMAAAGMQYRANFPALVPDANSLHLPASLHSQSPHAAHQNPDTTDPCSDLTLLRSCMGYKFCCA